MDRQGVTASILSISAPGLSFVSGPAARDLAQRINKGAAERRARSNGGFGAFALLPLPDVEGALAEMADALNVLELDGIGLLTDVGGVYLGDPARQRSHIRSIRRACCSTCRPRAGCGAIRISR